MTTRVLHVITRLPVGGAERLLADIVRKLDKDRYPSLVCCIQEKGELADEIERGGVRVLCLDRMQSRRFDFRAVKDLARLIRSERIGLVHTHLYHANLYGRLASLMARVPCVATVHNTYARTKLHRRAINYLLGRFSARVIAVSDEIRGDLKRYDGLPDEKIVTIHNGIDVSRLETRSSREEARAQLGIPADSLLLTCVARLEEQKGHRYLLEAMAMLLGDPQLRSPLKLLIAGDGRLKKPLHDQVQALNLSACVSMLGTRKDIPDILKASDLYVMPSLWEGLSIALLEAMASGLAVIASDVGGVSKVMGEGETGIKVQPGNAAQLAGAIKVLAGDPQRRRTFGLAGKERVEKEFSAAAMLEKLARVYASALDRPPE